MNHRNSETSQWKYEGNGTASGATNSRNVPAISSHCRNDLPSVFRWYDGIAASFNGPRLQIKA